MLSLCTKTIHSLLTLSHSEHHIQYQPQHHNRAGLRFLATAGKSSKPANLLQSVAIKKDSGCSGGPVDAIMNSSAGAVMEAMSCCTESLGFESSDQLEEEVIHVEEKESRLRENSRLKSRMADTYDRRTDEAKRKIFPKPLSWLNRNGYPSFCLKSGRSNGRLEIKQVRIDRPEILRASRQNGHLTLRLIKPHVQESDDKLVAVGESDDKLKEVRRKYEIARRCYDVTYPHREVPLLWSNHCVMSG